METSAHVPQSEPGRWLVVDSRRVRLREYQRIAPGFVTFCLAALLKLLRVRLRFPVALAHEFRIRHLADTDIPLWARPPLYDNGRPLVDALFTACFAYVLDAIGSTISLARVYLSDDGLVIAQVMVSLNVTPAGRKAIAHMSCVSRTKRGGFIATGTNRAHMDAPPSVDGEVVEAAGEDVLARHRARLAGADLVVFATADVEAELRVEHDEFVGFAVARGVYLPPDQAEIASLRAQTPTRMGDS